VLSPDARKVYEAQVAVSMAIIVKSPGGTRLFGIF
jgi:hypothetical protein